MTLFPYTTLFRSQLGSVVGPENSLVGTQVSQQYLTNAQYQHPQPIPSPGYSSLVHPGSMDIGSVATSPYQHGSIDALNFGNYMSPATTHAPSVVPSQRTSTGTIAVTGTPISSSSLEFQSVVKAPKTPLLGLSSLKQSPQRTVKASTAPHVPQVQWCYHILFMFFIFYYQIVISIIGQI